MSKFLRIIPKLEVKGNNLVKGVHLEGLRVLGNCYDFAKKYYEDGADELIYQDVVASLYERNSLNDIIEKTSKNIFIPLTVGGGIRNIANIKEVLNSGADKVSINTAALKNPEFINEAANNFGSSTIAINIEVIKNKDGKYYAYIDNGREATGKLLDKWVLEVQERGAGEIIIVSVDKDGTSLGFDLDIIKILKNKIKIPTILNGGIGKEQDILEVLKNYKVDGIALASLLHYNYYNFLKKKFSNLNEGNSSFLFSNKKFKNFQNTNIIKLKKYLNNHKINIRKK